jgi:hypothetical protein
VSNAKSSSVPLPIRPRSLLRVEALPIERHPSAVYLSSLDSGSRRTMRQSLGLIATLSLHSRKGNAVASVTLTDIFPLAPWEGHDPDGIAAFRCNATGQKFFYDRPFSMPFLNFPPQLPPIYCQSCDDFHVVASGPSPTRHPTLETRVERTEQGYTVYFNRPALPP